MVHDALYNLTNEEFQNLASSLILDVEDDSTFFSNCKQEKIPQLSLNDVKIGNPLGHGGFCSVFEIRSIQPHSIAFKKKSSSCTFKDEDVLTISTKPSSDSDKSNASAAVEGYMEDVPFVIKKIKQICRQDSNIDNTKFYTRAYIDLSCEVKFLTALSHPNIIKARGVSSCDLNTKHENYFVLLDRLYIILNEQLLFWERKLRHQRSCCRLWDQNSTIQLFYDRISVAYSLSSVFKYLHHHRLVYRDLKPENVGFDSNGIVKLFDFGLCKELRYKDLDKSPTSSKSMERFYKLTEYVGSVPYMAPEVFFGKSYNSQVDVFSFGMLLFQILFLKFFVNQEEDYDSMYLEQRVPYYNTVTPSFLPNTSISSHIFDMMERCWSYKISERPNFDYIHKILKDERKSLSKLISKDNGKK